MSAAPVERRARRLSALTFGRRGELAAMLVLLCKGYRILARNLRTPVGELDLVAARGRAIVFVEVKSRRDLKDAQLAIGHEQRARIARAARWWVARHPGASRHELRIDAIFLGAGRWPVHVTDLFELDLHG